MTNLRLPKKQRYKECEDCTDYVLQFFGCDDCKIRKRKEKKKEGGK